MNQKEKEAFSAEQRREMAKYFEVFRRDFLSEIKDFLFSTMNGFKKEIKEEIRASEERIRADFASVVEVNLMPLLENHEERIIVLEKDSGRALPAPDLAK